MTTRTNPEESNLWAITLMLAVDTNPLEQNTSADMVIVGSGFSGCSASQVLSLLIGLMTSDHIPRIQRPGDSGLSLFGYSGCGIAPGSLFGRAAADALATGDFNSLQLQTVDNYRIALSGTRQSLYEMGANTTHLLST